MFEKVTQAYSGGDATLEIVIMLAVAFLLGFLLRHIFCKPKTELMRQKGQASEPAPRSTSSQPEPRPEAPVATPQMTAGEALSVADSGPVLESDSIVEEAVAKEDDPEPVAATPETSPSDPAAEDDLRKIDGIGPKIAGLLKDDGIKTFAVLAKADPARLKAILDAAGPRFRMHDPHHWPEQAALLAEGRLDELNVLQASLKGQA